MYYFPILWQLFFFYALVFYLAKMNKNDSNLATYDNLKEKRISPNINDGQSTSTLSSLIPVIIILFLCSSNDNVVPLFILSTSENSNSVGNKPIDNMVNTLNSKHFDRIIYGLPI